MAEIVEGEVSLEIDSTIYDVDRQVIETVCPCCLYEVQDFYLHIRFFDGCGRFHLMKNAFEASKVEMNAEREKHEEEMKTAKEETETQMLLVQSHEMGEMKLEGLLAKAEYDLEVAKRELDAERAKHEEEMKSAKEQTKTQSLLARSSKLIIDSHKMIKSGLLEKAKRELNAERERHEEEMKTAKKAADSQVLSLKKRELELQELLDKAEKDLEEVTRGKAAKAKKKILTVRKERKRSEKRKEKEMRKRSRRSI